MEHRVHIGRNISKIRELLGVKQEALAATLNVSQQTISKIEQTKQLSQSVVDRIALALEVPVTTITQYDDNVVLESLKGSVNQNKVHSKNLEILEKIVFLFELILQLEQEQKSEPV
jgi:transcriptional regulator with XRE-family HTH domain